MIEVDELIFKTLKGLSCPVFKHRAITEDSTYIVYYVWDERGFLYAGNEPIGAVAMAAINIYSDDEAKELVKSIRARLRNAGFSIVSKREYFNDETERVQTVIEIMYEDLYG